MGGRREAGVGRADGSGIELECLEVVLCAVPLVCSYSF
jgi:hypothetical protein